MTIRHFLCVMHTTVRVYLKTRHFIVMTIVYTYMLSMQVKFSIILINDNLHGQIYLMQAAGKLLYV